VAAAAVLHCCPDGQRLRALACCRGRRAVPLLLLLLLACCCQGVHAQHFFVCNSSRPAVAQAQLCRQVQGQTGQTCRGQGLTGAAAAPQVQRLLLLLVWLLQDDRPERASCSCCC
jgi:hypothetical protein